MPQPRRLFDQVVLRGLPNGPSVTICGFSHGLPGAPVTASRTVSKELSKVVGGTVRQYSLLEGFHMDHIKEMVADFSEEDEARQLELDYIGKVLGGISKDALNHSERAEFLHPLLDSAVDQDFKYADSLHERIAEAVTAEPEKGVLASESTKVTLKEIDDYKTEISSILRRKFPREEGKIMDFVEGTTTFRSLLMARAALHRAASIGGNVVLFCGFQHPAEIRRFLENPKFLDSYVEKLKAEHPRLHYFYEMAEGSHAAIAELFERHSQKVETGQRRDFLRWLAHDVQLHQLMQLAQNKQLLYQFDMRRFTRQMG